MDYIFTLIILLFIFWALGSGTSIQRKARKDRYAEYLKSDEWQRKRYVVF